MEEITPRCLVTKTSLSGHSTSKVSCRADSHVTPECKVHLLPGYTAAILENLGLFNPQRIGEVFGTLS